MKENLNAAYKAAMRDMRKENIDTHFVSARIHRYEEQVRPASITGKTVNGKILY